MVVGGGAAGLAAAGALRQRGIGATVLERGGQVGESWRHRYDGLRLNSVRWMSSLPGYVMERRYGAFPSRDDWADYLERYARRYEIVVKKGVEVQRIDPDHESGWRLATTEGEVPARLVVVATGMDHTPELPNWPGRSGFEGQLLHSSDFRNPKSFANDDVLVVGGGNSATEIAHRLTHCARKVWIAIRTPPLILPRRFLGVSITSWAVPAIPLGDALLDRLSRGVQRLSFGDLSAYGLPSSPRGISAQRREGYVAPVDSGFVAAVKSGAIEVVDPIERLDRSEVVLEGGRRVRPDAVIAATGYRTNLRPLVGQLDVLGNDERPLIYGGAQSPRAPGLHFIGYHYKLIPTLPHLSTEARGIARAIERAV